MKLRIAKKVMHYNPNGKFNRHQYWHFRKLRPVYIDKSGRTFIPSFHDIHIIDRASHRLSKWIRRVRDRYKGKFATFEISNGTETIRGTAEIVKWDKKYVWLSNNPDFSGIRFPWSDIVKVE